MPLGSIHWKRKHPESSRTLSDKVDHRASFWARRRIQPRLEGTRRASGESKQVFLNRGGSLPRSAPSVDAEDVEPGEIFKTDQWRVSAARAKHMDPFLETLAYRVDTPYGSVVFTSDSSLCESVVEISKGTRTIVVNCWDHQSAMDTTVSSTIAGTLEAAQFAQKAGAKTLILTHQGSNLCQPGSSEKGIADISRLFDGEIIFAEELMTIEQ